MAEVLGIAASIIAVLQLAGAVTSMGYNYLGGVKRASNDIQDVMNEIHSLSQVLLALKKFADNNPQSTALQELNTKDGPLAGCAQELKALKSTLEKKGTSGLKKMVDSLTWPLKEKETAQLLARIERHKSLFTFALTADHISLSKAIEGYVQGASLAIQDLSKYIHKERQKENTIHALEKRKQVLNWLDLEDFERKHLEINERRQEDTGEWLLISPGFLEWIQTTGARLLWGYGIPGAGKTYLASLVVDHIKDKASATNNEIGLAYIYFDYKEQERQKSIHVLAKLVKQLLLQIPYLPEKIRELHDKREQDGKRPTFEELYTALLLVASLFTKVFFVFDALDECHKIKQRKDLLPLFRRMGADGMNLFLTSRPYPEDIQEALDDHGAAKIELVAKEDDIRVYIQKKIDESIRAKRLTQQNKDKIVSDLTEAANGMFLLVHFNIEYLCQQATPRKILTTLDKLKSSSESLEGRPLDTTYNLAMDHIRKQPKDVVALAITILTWLVKAHRTLTINELQEAVSIEPGLYELDELDLPDKATLIDVCAGLVTIDEKSGTIKLAHYTVQEYLLEYRIIHSDADPRLAISCITFVSFDIFDEPCASDSDISDRLNLHPFLFYAVENLSSHINGCDEDLTAEAVLTFLRKERCISSYCQARYFIRMLQSGTQPTLDRYLGGELQFNVACSLGHLAVVQLLFKQGIDILGTDNEGRTALHEATSEGHVGVVRLLLENSFDGNIKDKLGETALHKATLIQNVEIIQLLLEEGADILIPDNEGWTALHWAALDDSQEIVRLLLEKGADILALDNDNLTALHLAASQEHEETVKLLLEGGGDVLFTNSNKGCPILQWAASEGHEGAIRLLLKHGADISVSDTLGWTALHQAASEGHEGTVQLLLENGADILARTVRGWSILHGAAYEGREGTIRLLLKNRAEISATDGLGWTALHQAASEGHEGAVRLLLENKAKISTRCNNGCTALYLAACGGHEETVQLLLENGADISPQTVGGWTALHGAACGGHKETVRLLLKNGADISAKDIEKRTALHQAAANGYEETVQLLLENGADICASDHKGRTVLHQAAAGGHEKTVRLLLKSGAGMSAGDDRRRTALHEAANGGHEKTVQLLLENGAFTLDKDDSERTALHIAAFQGHEETIRVLIKGGADISARDQNGNAAIYQAVNGKRKGAILLLLKNGADIFAQNRLGWSVLHKAAHDGDEGIIQLLLDNGADISAKERQGWTALHCAASEGKEGAVRVLLKNGADISARDIWGRTSFNMSTYGNYKAVMQLLQTASAERKANSEKTEQKLETTPPEGQ